MKRSCEVNISEHNTNYLPTSGTEMQRLGGEDQLPAAVGGENKNEESDRVISRLQVLYDQLFISYLHLANGYQNNLSLLQHYVSEVKRLYGLNVGMRLEINKLQGESTKSVENNPAPVAWENEELIKCLSHVERLSNEMKTLQQNHNALLVAAKSEEDRLNAMIKLLENANNLLVQELRSKVPHLSDGDSGSLNNQLLKTPTALPNLVPGGYPKGFEQKLVSALWEELRQNRWVKPVYDGVTLPLYSLKEPCRQFIVNKFFGKPRCYYGEKCRFRHQLTSKEERFAAEFLWSMIESNKQERATEGRRSI